MKQITTLLIFALLTSCSNDTSKVIEEEKLKTNPLTSIFDEIENSSSFFKISNKSDTIINSQFGTIIYISKESFTYENGALPTSIKLELKEIFKPHEFVLNGLSTVTKDELLESAGMLFIDAVDSVGKQLMISNKGLIEVEFPLFHSNEGLKIFEGKFSEEANMEWENPKNPISWLEQVPIKLLNFYPENYVTIQPVLESDSLMVTTLPNGSQTEAVSEEPMYNYCGISKGLVDDLKSDQFKNTIISTREFEKRMAKIHNSCSDTVLRIYLENLDLNLWEIDSMVYEYLKSQSNGTAIAFRIFRDQRKTKLKIRPKDSTRGRLISSMFKNEKRRKSIRNLNKLTTIKFNVTSLGWINCDRFLSDSSAQPIALEISLKNISPRQTAKSYLVFNSINSILDLSRYENGKFHVGFGTSNTMQLPKGLKVTVVAISNDGKLPMLGTKEIILGHSKIESLNLKALSPEEFKKQLEKRIPMKKPPLLAVEKSETCCDNFTYEELFDQSSDSAWD